VERSLFSQKILETRYEKDSYRSSITPRSIHRNRTGGEAERYGMVRSHGRFGNREVAGMRYQRQGRHTALAL
jgi:hypothetical protein